VDCGDAVDGVAGRRCYCCEDADVLTTVDNELGLGRSGNGGGTGALVGNPPHENYL
jgi:hypothetical protein